MKIGIISPLNHETGISNYSETLAMELSKLGEKVDIISPKNFNCFLKEKNMKIISPDDYEVQNYDITHFQLGNSPFHEFQLYLLKKHEKELEKAKVITTVHDARNFSALNLKSLKSFLFILRSLNQCFFHPYDIVDRSFHEISKYLIFHNNSALNEYKNRYKLDPDGLRCIFHPAYRLTGDHPITSPINLEENRLVVPGYISPFKGQDVLIKAVSDIKNDFKLIFMGKIVDSEYGIYLDRLIKKMGLERKVEFTGFVSDHRFIEEIDRAKAVLVPRLMSSWLKEKSVFKIRKILGLTYLTNQSTSGVLTKALASGKPVICSKNGGFMDYVDSTRGILCADDIKSWKRAIQFVLKNPDAVKKMSINSQKFAMENLNPKVIAEAHLKLYNECLMK